MLRPDIRLQIIVNAQGEIGWGNSGLLEQRSCVTSFLISTIRVVSIGVDVNSNRNAEAHALLYII